jgi:hypothetical protein
LPSRPVTDTVPGVPLVIGVLLAFVVSLLAWAAGFDRDRAFYPTVLVALVAFLGFKSNLWWVAATRAALLRFRRVR